MSDVADDTAAIDRRRGSATRAEWAAPVIGLIVAIAVLWHTPDTARVTAGAAAALAMIVAWIAWQDWRTFTISDAALVTLAILAVTVRVVEARDVGAPMGATLSAAAMDGLVPGALLLLFRELYFRGKGFDGLGLGDVKLAAAGGLLVGMVGFSWALFAASLSGLLLVVGLRILSKRAPHRTDRLAFGAVLAPALFVVWLVQLWPLPQPFGS